MDFKIIYEDNDVLVLDKPAGVVIFLEGKTAGETLMDFLVEKYPELKSAGVSPRYGAAHRLDKDTSGVFLVAKNTESLIFFQKQFSAAAKALADEKNSQLLEKRIEKRYTALATGVIKENEGRIDAFVARSPADPRKQKAYGKGEPLPKSARQAATDYKVLQRFKDYTLLELKPQTGRKHQIRVHLAHIRHPIAGDKLYGFKDSPKPENLNRQFLHASYLKIKLPGGRAQEFSSDLPEDLKNVLEKIEL